MKRFHLLIMILCLAASGLQAQSFQLSDESHAYWYRICSAADGAAGLAVTDNLDNDATKPLTLEEASGSDAQLWKLQAEGEGVVLVNRATGRVLQPASKAAALYNLTQLQTTLVSGRSFVLSDLGESQLAISGQEADGTVRYLVAQPAEQAYNPATEALAGSVFAWTLTLARHDVTAVKDAVSAAPRVKVSAGRISVEPAVPYRVYAANGALANGAGKLVPGVYVVVTEYNKTTVLVK